MQNRKIQVIMVAVLLIFGIAVPVRAAGLQKEADTGQKATILFTHDMHSHLLPANDDIGESYGGYARLKTVIDQQKKLYPKAVLVDGGDFSMGSLFQTVYATDASELRIMGAMGYDAVTLGNHEYDYRAEGLANMLNAAVDSREVRPTIVQSNYLPPTEEDSVWDAFERYGVETEYYLLERGGIRFAIFGIQGIDSDACSPMSGMVLQDPAARAQEIVSKIRKEVQDPCLIVCLSHGGTSDDPKKSEDEILAKNVPEIDVIVSGHTHTTLEEPIVIGNTYIVSCGEYGKNLGVLNLEKQGEGFEMVGYELIPINAAQKENGRIANKVNAYKKRVEENYLSDFGDLTFDQVVAYNPYDFGGAEALDVHRESVLGNLIADSYRHAVKEAEGDDYVPVDFALTVNGSIRGSLACGELTLADVYNVASLGIGADGIPGYPLVSAWITGKDLKNAFEVDASVTGIMPDAQLYYSGMEFTFNPNRILFDKVTDCFQVLEDGTRVEIQDDKLYRVVTGLYCGQMLGSVNSQSYGILNITPRDAQGNEITDLEAYILHDRDGHEIKEWYALVSYLQDMGTITEQYSKTEGRKVIEDTWNPLALLRDAGWITWTAVALMLLIILMVVFLIRLIAHIWIKKEIKEGKRA